MSDCYAEFKFKMPTVYSSESLCVFANKLWNGTQYICLPSLQYNHFLSETLVTVLLLKALQKKQQKRLGHLKAA